MPFLKISNNGNQTEAVNLYFEDYGSGQPVILIHGWPLSHRMWEPQVRPLIDAGYRCIAYDRRGFGDSDKPWHGHDYDTLAGDLRALLTGLDLQNAVLVGFSMGGGEVARYFGRYGADRVVKAMLISAVTPYMLKTSDNPDGVEKSVFEEMKQGVKEDRLKLLDDFSKQFVNWGMLDHPISEDLLHYNKMIAAFASPRATLEDISAFAETDFRKDMEKITVPTLVVHGSEDQIVPVDVSGKRAAKMIANSQLEVIDGAPHGLYATHTEKLNKLMLDFLRS